MKLLRKVRGELLSFVLIIFFIGFSSILENPTDSQSRFLSYIQEVDKRDVQKIAEKPKGPPPAQQVAHNHIYAIPPPKVSADDPSTFYLTSFPSDPALENPCFVAYTCYPFIITPYLNYTMGRGVGYDCGYATTELFIIPAYTLTMSSLNYPFLDIRGHYLDNGSVAANCGVGWRSYSTYFQRTIGVNLYYDYFDLKGKSFNQLTAGFEFVNGCFDFRFNGYLSLGRRSKQIEECFFTYPGDYWMKKKEYLASFQGFNMEIGRNLLTTCDGTCLYGAVGPYYFDKEHCWSAYGGQARLEMYFCNRFSLGVVFSKDSFFGDSVQGELSIPFSSSPCSYRCCKPVLPPRFFEIIPVADVCSWDWNF